MAYGIIAWFATAARIHRPSDVRQGPPVTILKPLCGVEPETYACLRSFCDQDYPAFQLVFGVSDAYDPAIDVVRRLQREFPHVDIQIAIDRRQHGSNRKVSNLINMMPFVRHEFLVIADSDVQVTRDYLGKIVPPLLERDVGIVTCCYRGHPGQGLGSHLESMFINEWFIPSVRVAAMAGSRSFAFGTTIAVRRQTLTGIGGFAVIANQLADDYRLGELTRRLGLRTVLSDVVVTTCIAERSVAELVGHELRWLRTIRALRPIGYGFAFITFGVPVAALGTLLARGSPIALGMLAVTSVARIMLHLKAGSPQSAGSRLSVLPLRDLLSLALWGWSFATRRVHWRDEHFQVTRDGAVLPIARI